MSRTPAVIKLECDSKKTKTDHVKIE
jgi:hypothetical protein